MGKSYEHTQIGYLTISAIGGVFFLLIYLTLFDEFSWASVLVMLIIGVALLLFATLNTKIQGNFLEISFGIGVIRKNIALSNIQSVEVIKYPWYYGWGLRYSLGGEWVYSVSGLKAVRIVTKTGGKYIVGTDEPEELASAVQKATGK